MELPHIINQIQLMVQNGLIEDAKRFEKKTRTEHPEKLNEIGSVHTELELLKFITQHPEMLKMKDVVRKLAQVDDPVLITGETGTGKEIVARALHGNREGQFVAINCTSLPDYLLESELFGHVRGAFTGAVNDKPGLFETAHNGSILLDEIGDMPYEMQAKLLRVLQDKHGRRVGANLEYDIKARILCSTNKNLQSKGFRDDLYWRISTFQIKLLPLRDRLADLGPIIESLDTKKVLTHEQKLEVVNTLITKDIISGNVRQIQQIVKRKIVLG